MLIDAGANTNCKKENFLQFAEMGKIYLEKTGKKINPKIGLLNIGTEETKGSEIHKEAYMYLKENYEEKGLNFIGNIEARDPFTGDIDLVVSDGFTGNIFIKTLEGFRKDAIINI
jgi:fatty acid synthesis protein